MKLYKTLSRQCHLKEVCISNKNLCQPFSINSYELCDGAIDGRIPIGSERKKRHVDDRQPISILHTRDDVFVLEIRWFKHEFVSVPSSYETISANGVCCPTAKVRHAVLPRRLHSLVLRFLLFDSLLSTIPKSYSKRQQDRVRNPNEPKNRTMAIQQTTPAFTIKARSRGPFVFLMLKYVPIIPPINPMTAPITPPIHPASI